MATVVAELGVNHDGDPEKALAMIRAAKECGCDAVKVQSFKASDFLRWDDPNWDVTERCEIWEFLWELADEAHHHGLLFGVTPQVKGGVAEAVDAGADYLKVASECITQQGLIRACLDTGLPTWVSVGMATAEEVRAVPEGAKLMVCTSLYPCPDEEAHLLRLNRIHGSGRWAGFSDHTQGVEAATVAAFCGAEMIEKHFTLDRHADGPDHWFSADPDEMRALVQAVRRVERMRGRNEIAPPASRNLIAEGCLRS